MKTNLMDCPNCGYFIDVEERNGKLRCHNCGSLLSYDLKQNKLTTIEAANNNSPKEKSCNNSQINSVLIMECPGCKANLEIDYENLISFCPYCGKKLIYNPNGISYILTEREKTKRADIINNYKLEKIKLEHEEKRKDELHDFIMLLLPMSLIIGAYLFVKFVVFR